MSTFTGGRRFTASALHLWGGLLVWAVYFLVVYLLGAVACQRGFADERIAGAGLVPFVAAVGLVAALGVTGALAASARRRSRAEVTQGARFVASLAWTLCLFAIVALAWAALAPLLLRTGCA